MLWVPSRKLGSDDLDPLEIVCLLVFLEILPDALQTYDRFLGVE